MPIFDRLKHGVDVTKFKADQLMRINRVQGEIDTLRQNIAQIQKNIYTKAYDLHQAGSLANPELENFCLLIDDIYHKIRDKENDIAIIRTEDVPKYIPPPIVSSVANPCPECGFDIPSTAAFCPNCGHTIRDDSVPISETQDGMITCPVCGNNIMDTMPFCPECGHKMSESDLPASEP